MLQQIQYLNNLSPSVCVVLGCSVCCSSASQTVLTCCSTSPVPPLAVSVCVYSLCLPSGVGQFVLCAWCDVHKVPPVSGLPFGIFLDLDFCFFYVWFELCIWLYFVWLTLLLLCFLSLFFCLVFGLAPFSFCNCSTCGFVVKLKLAFCSPLSCLLSLICIWVLHYNLKPWQNELTKLWTQQTVYGAFWMQG